MFYYREDISWDHSKCICVKSWLRNIARKCCTRQSRDAWWLIYPIIATWHDIPLQD
jgi:hypothetical protein